MIDGIRKALVAVTVVVFGANSLALAQDTKCKTIKGQMSETIVPASQAPNDPFGRVLGLFTGDFGGVATVPLTAYLVTQPQFSNPGGPSSVMMVRHVFLLAPGDTVITLGKTIFTPAPATEPGQTNYVSSVCPFAPCLVENPQVLTIIGGTGRYVGATGELRNLGLGNLDLLNNIGVFTFVASGEICLPKAN
ncbi:MAG TPA: hypothetical protein VHZ74_22710 [Bryobacteraceae bacterium]|jgi:hypothetical protein|nr:hypothetical protein [Bryobacteraceae bacterium]